MRERSSQLEFPRHLARTVVACCLTVILISQSAQGSVKTLESTIRNDPAYSLFSQAMDLIDFWERLENEDSVTVIIPTDQVMELEGSDFLMKSVLMAQENRVRLEELIASHVTLNPILLDNDSRSSLVRMLSNDCLSITRIGDATKVGPEAFVISSVKIGNNRLLTVDRLLITNYLPVEGCT